MHCRGGGLLVLLLLVVLLLVLLVVVLAVVVGLVVDGGALQMAGGSAVSPTFPVQVLWARRSLQSTVVAGAVLPVTVPQSRAVKWMPRAVLVRERLCSTWYWPRRWPRPRCRTAGRARPCSCARSRSSGGIGGAGLARVGDVDAVAAGRLDLVPLHQMSSLRAPMKIGRGRALGTSGSSTRARMLLCDSWTRVLLKIAAKVLSSTLLLWSISTSRWVADRGRRRRPPAPLWRSNRFEVIRPPPGRPRPRRCRRRRRPGELVVGLEAVAADHGRVLAARAQVHADAVVLEDRVADQVAGVGRVGVHAGPVLLLGDPADGEAVPGDVVLQQLDGALGVVPVSLRSTRGAARLPVASRPALAPRMVRRAVSTLTFSS